MTTSTSSRGGRSRLAARSALAIGTSLLFAVTACTSGSTSHSGSKSGKKIAIVMPESVPGYAKQIACGAVAEGKRLGYDVANPQAPSKPEDAAEQAQVLQSVLATNPDGLIYDPADATAGTAAIKAAAVGGLPVVNVDTQLSEPSLAVSFVSSSHEKGGKLGGELLAKQIGNAGDVVALGVIPSNPITKGRILGFQEAMKESPNIHVVSVQYPDFDVNKLAAATSAILTRYPNLKGIYTTNDTVASGVATALRGAQKVGKIKVVTWDLQPVGIRLLQEGAVTGTVVQQPRQEGVAVMDQLANKLEGKPVQQTVVAPLSTATSENINDPAIKAQYYSNAC